MANDIERIFNLYARTMIKVLIHLTGILMVVAIISYIEYMFKFLVKYGICLCVGCPTEVEVSVIAIAIRGYEDLGIASLPNVNSPSLVGLSSTNSVSIANLSSTNSLSLVGLSSTNSVSIANLSAITSVSIVAPA